MRKTVTVFALVCLCAGLAAAQQGKMASEWKCSKPAPMHALDVGDNPGHMYAIDQIKCTAVKGDIGGVKEKEGSGTEFADINGDTSAGHGIFVETLANGDKMHVAYEFTGKTQKGAMLSGSNKWHSTNGTGKLRGIRATGTCDGKGNPDGSSTYTCTGTYTIPK